MSVAPIFISKLQPSKPIEAYVLCSCRWCIIQLVHISKIFFNQCYIENGNVGDTMLRGRRKVSPGLNKEGVELIELRRGRHLRVLCISKSSIQQACNGTGRLNIDEATRDPQCQIQPMSIPNSGGNSGTEDAGTYSVVVFMLHGVGGSIEVWSSQIDFLLSKTDPYRIVAVDFLGHGHSCAPKEVTAYEFSEYQKDIIELFQCYHGQKNFIIGHSYGCSFAVLLAHQYGLLVNKLVLISGGSPQALSPEPGLLRLPELILNCFRYALQRIYLRQLFYRWDETVANNIIIPSIYVLKYTMMGQWWPEGNVAFHSNIKVDTLLVHGRQDTLISVAEVQETHETIKKSQLKIIEDAGHMVMMEKAEEVNYSIYVFLTENN